MGIDRIGKGGAPPSPQTSEVGGAEKATKTGAVDKPFSVERTRPATSVESVAGVSHASPLAQLKAGHIDMDRYLDLRVDEATKALDKMPASDLADVKKMLREQLATDPTLVDMVKRATGKIPNPTENE